MLGWVLWLCECCAVDYVSDVCGACVFLDFDVWVSDVMCVVWCFGEGVLVDVLDEGVSFSGVCFCGERVLLCMRVCVSMRVWC